MLIKIPNITGLVSQVKVTKIENNISSTTDSVGNLIVMQKLQKLRETVDVNDLINRTDLDTKTRCINNNVTSNKTTRGCKETT